MKFRNKILVAPLVAVGLMLMLGVIGWLGVRSIENKVDELASVNMQHLVHALDARDNLRRVNGDIFRLFVLISSSNDTAAVKNQWAALDAGIETTRKAFAGLNGNADAEEQNILREIDETLTRYRSAVDAAIDIAQGDIASGAGMVQGAEKLFEQIATRVDAYVDKQKQEGANTLAVTRAESARTVTVTLALTVLAATVSLLLAWRVAQNAVSRLNGIVALFSRVETSLDFTGRLAVQGNDEFDRAGGAFNRLLGRLQESFREISGLTASVSQAARELASVAQGISSSASTQSEAASSMAASMEEMTVSIQQVSDRAREASQLSAASGEHAQEGEVTIGRTVVGISEVSQTVRSAAEALTRLEQQSERIGQIVSVIKEVADQTNLLALNAAIEAARAGEQGRGFAVVADEVRKLAERTSQSTQEIAQTVTEIQAGASGAVRSFNLAVAEVDNSVGGAGEANVAMQAIGASSRSTVAMAEEISLAIREQSAASTGIAQQVEQIARMAEQNSAASQSTAETAKKLAELATRMQHVANQYRV